MTYDLDYPRKPSLRFPFTACAAVAARQDQVEGSTATERGPVDFGVPRSQPSL